MKNKVKNQNKGGAKAAVIHSAGSGKTKAFVEQSFLAITSRRSDNG